MAHAKDDANENHWPGYVDALTTMLMVLTFVMMILGIAVFAMSQNVSRIIVETIAKAALIETPGENVPVPELTEQILEWLRLYPPRPAGKTAEQSTTAAGNPSSASTPGSDATPLQQREQAKLSEDILVQSSERAHVPSAPGPVKTDVAGQALVIEFQPRATRLDEAAARSLAETLASDPRFKQAQQVEIRAVVDRSAASLTDARRVAYYRAMLVRAAVLRSGLSAAQIRVFNDETLPTDGSPSRELVRVVPIGAAR